MGCLKKIMEDLSNNLGCQDYGDTGIAQSFLPLNIGEKKRQPWDFEAAYFQVTPPGFDNVRKLLSLRTEIIPPQ